MVEAVQKSVLKAGWLLAIAALLGTGLLWLTAWHAEAYIKENERNALLASLNAVIPANSYDNDLPADVIHLDVGGVTGGAIVTRHVYRARHQGEPVSVAMTTVAPDGYSGNIWLLVGIDVSGRLSGVRVIQHHETPGLGDAIEADRSDWIYGFDGKSLTRPDAAHWKVKKDGGEFDQFTGATITPRAVVKAVHGALRFYAQHRDELLKLPSQQVLHAESKE